MRKALGHLAMLALFVAKSTNVTAMEHAVPDPKSAPSITAPQISHSPSATPRPPSHQSVATALYNKAELEAWFRSDVARGNRVTQGDPTLHIRSTSNQLPVEEGDGYRVVICAGAGCPIKVPYTFSNAALAAVKSEMAAAQSAAHCEADTAKCEMIGLQAAAVAMEKKVHRDKLSKITLAEEQAYATETVDEDHKATLQDCVDQTTNGITYLYILAQKGWMHHHTIIPPGVSPIHFWTRVKNDQGKILGFDLYHRGEVGIPPIVECENC